MRILKGLQEFTVFASVMIVFEHVSKFHSYEHVCTFRIMERSFQIQTRDVCLTICFRIVTYRRVSRQVKMKDQVPLQIHMNRESANNNITQPVTKFPAFCGNRKFNVGARKWKLC